jgi:hypothetical protein
MKVTFFCSNGLRGFRQDTYGVIGGIKKSEFDQSDRFTDVFAL